MLALTIQDRRVFEEGYSPKFLKSPFVRMDGGYLSGYSKMFKVLQGRVSRPKYHLVDSFYWFWLKNPYLKFHKIQENTAGNYGKDSVACFLDINPGDVLISDFDKWCEYIEDNKGSFSRCLDVSTSECVQGVGWDLNKDNILSMCRFSDLQSYDGCSMSELLKVSLENDIKEKVIERS